MTKSLKELGRDWDISPDFYPAYVKDLHAGKITVAPGVYVDGLGQEAWAFESTNPTLYFRLHSFGFLAQLVSAWISTGDLQLKETATLLVSRWIDRHGVPDDSPVWHGHQTALRASVLSSAYGVGLLDAETIAPTLKIHADRLELDEHYDGAWNHGIDQCLALLDLAKTMSLPKARTVAIDRIIEAIPELVDEEGVVAEQAPHYAGYVYSRLRVVEKRFEQLGVALPREFARVEMIPEFLAWATRPDGNPVPIGDTSAGEWKSIEGDVWFLGNADGRLTHPVGNSRVYRDGWAFIRSGWDGWAKADPNIDSLLTLRYGTYRRIHGHRDHTSITWFAHGQDILSDPGFSGYGDREKRNYELLEHAHNGVVVDGAGKFKWQNGTALRSYSANFLAPSGIRAYSITVSGQAYERAKRTRNIVHIPELSFLLVRDTVTSDRPVTARTTWLIGDSFRENKVDEETNVLHITSENLNLQVKVLTPLDSLRVKNADRELQAYSVASGGDTSQGRAAIVAEVRNRQNPVVMKVFAINHMPKATMPDGPKGPLHLRFTGGEALIISFSEAGTAINELSDHQLPTGYNLE